MNKLYAVEVKTVVMVLAESEKSAEADSFSEKFDICLEEEFEFSCLGEVSVKEIEKKCYGWDGECIPYGGDGNTRIKDILDSQLKQKMAKIKGGDK